MEPRCEKIARNVFPSIRSTIAEIMMKEYGMSQVEIAKKLGVSQAAVSYYLKGLRAKGVELIKNDEKLMKKIEGFVKDIVYGDVSNEDAQEFFCDICRIIRSSKK